MTKTILVVDDDGLSRTLVSTALARLGHVVLCAENGVDAWTMCTTLEISLVVSDVDMPQMNGLQLLAMIRRRLPEVPVIMMSSSSMREEVDWKALGALAFLAKPFCLQKLLPLLASK